VSEVINKLFLRVAVVLRRNLAVHAYHNLSGTWWILSASLHMTVLIRFIAICCNNFCTSVAVISAATMLIFGVNITFHSTVTLIVTISFRDRGHTAAMFKTNFFSPLSFLYNYCNVYPSCLIYYLVLCILKSFSSIASLLL
jgi:hypothetical protein